MYKRLSTFFFCIALVACGLPLMGQTVGNHNGTPCANGNGGTIGTGCAAPTPTPAGLPAAVQQNPTVPTMLLACTGTTGCEPGNGTATLIQALDIPKSNAAPAQCPGWSTSNCQAFAETDIANCQSSAPSVTAYAYNNNHPIDFAQTVSGTPALTTIYYWGNTSGSNCASFGGSNTTISLLNFSQTSTQADVKAAVTSTYIPTGAIIADDELLDYGAPLGSYTICDTCGHTFTTGGGSTVSLEQDIADSVSALKQVGLNYYVMVNGLSLPGGTTVGCSTVTSNVCYGDSFNPGFKNSEVYISDLGQASMVREEWAITRTNTAGAAPQANWGANLAYLLNTAYESNAPPLNYQSNTDCTNLPGGAGYPTGEESILWAMQVMGPYLNSRPEDYEQPYGCGVEKSITTDNGFYPIMGIVPTNPINNGGAYTFCTGTCTTAHDATWAGTGCTASGGPVSTGSNDAGGIQNLVYGCVAAHNPVLYRKFNNCSVYLYDVGPCEIYINTDQTTAATIATTGYTYELSFSGSEFGQASGGSASYAAFATSFLSWLPTTDPGGTGLNHYQYLLYNAMSSAWSANGSAYDNGWFSFGAPSTSLAANGVAVLTTNKPPGY